MNGHSERNEQERPADQCWCGVQMVKLGVGAFPYECIAKDKHPQAMVYRSGACGHSSWSYQS